MFVLFGVDPNPSNMSERDRYCQLETCSLLPINHQQVWGVLSWEIFLATSFKHEKYGWQIKKKIVSRKPVLIFQSTIVECKLVLESRWRKEFTIHIVYMDSISHFLSLDPESSPDCNHWYSFFHSITFLAIWWRYVNEWHFCLSSFKITVPSSGKTRCSGKLSSGQNSQ